MPVPSQINDHLIQNLSSHFTMNYANTTSWGNVLSIYRMLPNLRGLWTMSSVDSANAAYDASGLGKTLAMGNLGMTYGIQGLVPYVNMASASFHYLWKADDADFSITGALTQITWIQFHAGMKGANDYFYGKYVVAGDNCSYLLYKSTTDKISFGISDDGTLGAHWFYIDDVGVNYEDNKWMFIAGRYTPQTEVALFVNNNTNHTFNKYTNVTGIPAAIKDGTANLTIGRANATNYHDGYIAITALCAAALPDMVIEALFAHSKALFGIR